MTDIIRYRARRFDALYALLTGRAFPERPGQPGNPDVLHRTMSLPGSSHPERPDRSPNLCGNRAGS
ncbi:hypothetical protein ACN2XU_20155 [Primorskyibacter sp. 2E107]|uniref:hypothetical protein n=1 Tax=Primorskyibacter sp. 2E107 TaxID=3403458 RepID=UPI003AF8AC49